MANYNEQLKELRHQMVLDIECILHEHCFDLSEPHDLRNPLNGFRNGCSGDRIIEAITLEDGDAVVTQSCRNPNRFEDALECKVEDLTTETLVKLLEQVKEDCRCLKIKELRNLIIKAGEYIEFDGKESFLFCDNQQISDDMDATYHNLDEVRILGFDNVEFVTSDIDEIGSNRVNYEIRQVPDETLDQIIAYIKKRPKKIDIELTDEQLKVMDEFYNAIKKMEEAGIAVIRDAEPDGGFYFVNGKGLEFAGGDGVYDSDNYVSVQDQINEMEMFSYGDLSDWLFCSDFEDLYAKRI